MVGSVFKGGIVQVSTFLLLHSHHLLKNEGDVMTPVLKLQAERVKVRQSLKTHLEIVAEHRAADFQSVLAGYTDRLGNIDTEIIAARWLEPEPVETRSLNDGEGAEYRSMLAGANLGLYFDALMGKGVLEGREAELQKHHGLPINQFPLDLLAEHRAISPAPTDTTQGNQAAIVQPVFADGATAFMQVRTPVVPVGDSIFPILSTMPTVGGFP